MDSITIKDVAKICGVGVSTVSRAINNHPDINEETKQKIMDTIRQYHYVPNNSARNLKRSDSNTIAVLIKGISNPFFIPMIQVLERETKKKKYSFVLQQVDEKADEIETAIQLEKEKRLRGIVFLGGCSSHAREKLEQLSVPFVIATADQLQGPEEEEYPSVNVDNKKESEKLVDYLIACGHQRIAVLAAYRQDESIGKLRLEGYSRALQRHGIPWDDSLIMYTRDKQDIYTMENGYALTKELLKSDASFSCIYALSDSMAIGACKAIFEAGKRVPQDYSVAGFDGLEYASFYEPSITTICQPREEMAEATIQILFDLIKKKKVENRHIFEARLVEGQSTMRMNGYGNH